MSFYTDIAAVCSLRDDAAFGHEADDQAVPSAAFEAEAPELTGPGLGDLPTALPDGFTAALRCIDVAAARYEDAAELAARSADVSRWRENIAARDRCYRLFDAAIRRAARLGAAKLAGVCRFQLRFDWSCRTLAILEIDGARFACPADPTEGRASGGIAELEASAAGDAGGLSEAEAIKALTAFAADEPDDDLPFGDVTSGTILLKLHEADSPLGCRRPAVADRFLRELTFTAYDGFEEEVREFERKLDWVSDLADQTARQKGIRATSSWPMGWHTKFDAEVESYVSHCESYRIPLSGDLAERMTRVRAGAWDLANYWIAVRQSQVRKGDKVAAAA